MQPTLLNSCARATTASEARYRISAKEFTPRKSRVIALDRVSAGIIGDLAGRAWDGGHFLVFESALPDDALLRRLGPGNANVNVNVNVNVNNGGGTALLSEELDDADTVVMVASPDAAAAATAGGTAAAASLIGDTAAGRAIMSVGLVVQAGASSDGIVAALRPNAMVLVVLTDPTDLPEVLTALRV